MIQDNNIMNGQDSIRVAIIGLGYVGLPLLCHFATKYQCMGLDINEQRILQLAEGIDVKKCVDPNMLCSLSEVTLTSDWKDLRDCNVFIVTAPTPIDEAKQPDLHSLKEICAQLGKVVKQGDVVVFESTVAPGTTEEICVPIIEHVSSLRFNEDFSVGYSPERINIGDASHTLSSVPKIVSASNKYTLDINSDLYYTSLGCEIVPASSIKTAEAAKLYENVQRDVLIALANQYSEYCKAEGIDIREVTQCASTKWNFAEVYPGLVGGHCIGVDPYYLLQRANSLNVDLSIVNNARNVNEDIVYELAIKIMNYGELPPCEKSILLLGFSYKPNTSDIRNTKVAELYRLLANHCKKVDCFDPVVDKVNVMHHYGIELIDSIADSDLATYDMIVNVVSHECFTDLLKDYVVCFNMSQFI